MKRITIDYILSRYPCYTREELEVMFKGRKYVYWPTVIKEAKPEDAIWLLAHPDFVEGKRLHLLACDFAEHVEPTVKGKELVQAKRDWVAGKITDKELDKLRKAYSTAYRAAYSAAYRAADWAAYSAAYWAADSAADRAERKWQLEQLAKAIKESE